MLVPIHQLSQVPPETLKTRSTFDCGVPALNQYLAQTASQHERNHMTRTFCAVTDRKIVGYYALTTTETDVSALSDATRKRLRLPYGNIPAMRLVRLAIDISLQGQGLGTRLLMDALKKVETVAASTGCVGLFVDAKDNAAATFYTGFDFKPSPSDPLLLFLPLPTIQTLFS